MHNLVFFASGSGTNFQSVIDAIESGRIKAQITGLVTNRPEAGAIKRAQKHGIPTHIIDSNAPDFEQKLLNLLLELNPDLIVLAGYLKKIPAGIINNYSGQIINIHPSLLPKYGGKGYYGMNVHRAVIENKEDFSGCTVHFVDEIYDNGQIIEQIEVPVLSTDTPESLAEKILHREHKLLPNIVHKLLTQTP